MGKTIYFSGLNGLRAIASLAVVVSHTTLALGLFHLSPFIFGKSADGNPQGLLLAGFGVTIFFTLSGFLITYLLQAERDKQNIDIRKFYVRRILRIWPLYYLYLLAVLLFMFANNMPINFTSLWFYIFYSANVPFALGGIINLLAHYWSLGAEEQFYLFWPWLNKAFSTSILVYVLVFLAGLLLGTKFLLHLLMPASVIKTLINATGFHYMMLGGLGAILYKNQSQIFLRLFDNKITQFVCWIVIFLLVTNNFHVASIIDNEIVSIVALGLIIGQINQKNRLVNLENNVFDFLGKISYGIYVIHPLVIQILAFVLNPIALPAPYQYVVVYSSILGVTIALAHVSYQYFERYFLSLKKQFVVIDSASNKHEK
ncbi:MAG: acyltransferase [Bacteroidetes bacterium]|nr:MAG: acyltransferase [Bacteroidota bacterium]